MKLTRLVGIGVVLGTAIGGMSPVEAAQNVSPSRPAAAAQPTSRGGNQSGMQPQIPRPPGKRPMTPPPTLTQPVERLGDNVFRIGSVRVDTARREVSVDGFVNEVQTLEFIANTKGGFKAYESAVELDTNAINFNLGLILIGLDKANAVVPKIHRDRSIPKGDPLEVWVDIKDADPPRRIRAEQLVYNLVTKTTLPEGPWVYTGSIFVGRGNAYLADIDGTLIGFVHTPSPLIENPARLEGPYGANRLNPSLNLKAGTPVTLTVRALPR
jgi:hypothetical protein